MVRSRALTDDTGLAQVTEGLVPEAPAGARRIVAELAF
jgi:hypothetical protein